jgi:hypothetical protein
VLNEVKRIVRENAIDALRKLSTSYAGCHDVKKPKSGYTKRVTRLFLFVANENVTINHDSF